MSSYYYINDSNTGIRSPHGPLPRTRNRPLPNNAPDTPGSGILTESVSAIERRAGCRRGLALRTIPTPSRPRGISKKPPCMYPTEAGPTRGQDRPAMRMKASEVLCRTMTSHDVPTRERAQSPRSHRRRLPGRYQPCSRCGSNHHLKGVEGAVQGSLDHKRSHWPTLDLHPTPELGLRGERR